MFLKMLMFVVLISFVQFRRCVCSSYALRQKQSAVFAAGSKKAHGHLPMDFL